MENVDEREKTEEISDEEMTAEQGNDKERDGGEKHDEMEDMMEGKKLAEDEILEGENEEEDHEGD